MTRDLRIKLEELPQVFLFFLKLLDHHKRSQFLEIVQAELYDALVRLACLWVSAR